MKKYTVLFFLFILNTILFAQDNEPMEKGGNEKFAKYCMKYKNYNDALIEYKELLKNDSSNAFYKHQIARCHLHLNNDKSKAIPILEKLNKRKDYHNPEILYDLGLSYLFTSHISKARKALNTYLDSSATDTNRLPAKRMLKMCNNYEKLKQEPVNINIKNLGEEINSEYPDFLPMIPGDESYLVFSSHREESTGRYITSKGRYNSDIFYCRHHSGEWRKTRELSGSVNTRYTEYGVCMTSDGNDLLVVFDPERGNRFLLHSNHEKQSYSKPDPYSKRTINKKNRDINGAWITKDGKHMLISAKQPGGYGGFDLYISHKLPNRQWSEPENLGVEINSPYNESYPYLTPDEDFLIFASEGHNSMGGYDLMLTPFSTDTSHKWNIRNLGYPVNTPVDDHSISFTDNMRYAYKPFLKPKGFGNMDIYRITFKDTSAEYVMLKGQVKIEKLYQQWQKTLEKKETPDMDSLMSMSPYKKLQIEAINTQSGNKTGKYRADPITGSYAIALQPGSYKIHFQYPGYKTAKLELKIPERRNKNSVIHEKINLKRQ